MKKAESVWEARIDAALGFAAALILFALMLITFVDVVARYLFNFPLRGAFEISELLLLVLIFAGLPLVSHADEHVTMDFIDHMLPEPALRALERVVHALCAAVLFFLTWQIWLKAGKIAAYGDTTDVLRIVVAPFVYFMTAMIALTGVVHLFKIVYLPPRRGPQGTT
jgi:TRAP-type C4-dicarboxylate transport system permease small subunit